MIWKYFTLAMTAAALAAMLAAPAGSPARADEAALEAIHNEIVRKYSSVEHITSDALTKKLANPEEADDIVLFDIREVGEHNVSRLENATQVTPGIWTSTFMRKYGERIKGKTVVFYCSVGRRSSYAASYLQKTLKANGAKSVVNLKGGIFSWHNQNRPLSDTAGATPYVHPYDNYWGRLLERRNLARFTPRPKISSPEISSSAEAQTSQ